MFKKGRWGLTAALVASLYGMMMSPSLSYGDHGRFPCKSEFRVSLGRTNAYPGDRFPIALNPNGELVEKIVVVTDRAFGDLNEITVRVDGENFGPLITPYRETRRIDPAFTISIGRTVYNIDLLVGGHDGVEIREVQLFTRVPLRGGQGRLWNPREMQTVAALSWDLVETIRHLQIDFLTPDEFKADFLPIKKQAAQVYASSTARGDTSRSTYQVTMHLIMLIDNHKEGLERLMERDGAYEAIVNILRIQEALADLYE